MKEFVLQSRSNLYKNLYKVFLSQWTAVAVTRDDVKRTPERWWIQANHLSQIQLTNLTQNTLDIFKTKSSI